MSGRTLPFLLLAAMLTPLLGCNGVARNEQSWYKPPNIVTRSVIVDAGTLTGVQEPGDGSWIDGANPFRERVTHINPWQYEANVPTDNQVPPASMERRCLYDEILRLEAAGETQRAMMYRNMLQDAIIGVSNTVGSAHVATILGVEDALNLTTGFMDILFDGIAVMVTPPGTKTIFAGLSGVAGATRSLVNEEIYTNIIAPAVLKAIEAERVSEWERIAPFRKLPVSQYNVEQAIADAIAYHEAWSFYRGMQRLATDAQTRLAQTTASAQQRINTIMGVEHPQTKIARLQGLIAALPAATQAKIYTSLGTNLTGASFMAGVPAITDTATFVAARATIQDATNLQTIADRLEGAYLSHRP